MSDARAEERSGPRPATGTKQQPIARDKGRLRVRHGWRCKWRFPFTLCDWTVVEVWRRRLASKTLMEGGWKFGTSMRRWSRAVWGPKIDGQALAIGQQGSTVGTFPVLELYS